MLLRNETMLWGLALIAIPVVLHFLMRAKPKQFLFPALRFIQQRKLSSVRRLRLRHVALLLLRAIVIGAIVLALARPVLPAADYGLSGYETSALISIVAGAIALYFLFLNRWQKSGIPRHQVLNRRTYLRAATIGGALLLAMLLVAWPYASRIAGEYAEPVTENMPVAAVFVFDTSLSMDLRQENETRLEKAQRIMLQHLDKLPARSKVAVASTAKLLQDADADKKAKATLFFQADLLSARARIDDLEVRPDAIPLTQRILSAISLQNRDRQDVLDSQQELPEPDRQDRFIREVYVFTDLAKTGWKNDDTIRKRLAELERLNVYVIDVGAKEPMDLSLAPLKLSSPAVLKRSRLTVETAVIGVGEVSGEAVTVTCSVSDLDGQLLFQDSRRVAPIEGTQPVEPFDLRDALLRLDGDFLQGKVTIRSRDSLRTNDAQYFTIQVRRPPKILVVSETPRESRNLANALAPEILRRRGSAPYEVQVVGPGEIAGRDLAPYHAVCMVNVTSPAQEDWEALEEYVQTGGSLIVFLGRRDLRLPAYNNETARNLLPIRQLAGLIVWPETTPEYLNVVKEEHALFGYFKEQRLLGGLTGIDILRIWSVKPQADADVLAYFTSPLGAKVYPALLERTVRAGRVMLLATGVDLKPPSRRRENFNDLPRYGGVFVVFVHRMMTYLIARSLRVANIEAGARPFLPARGDKPIKLIDFIKPNAETKRNIAVPAANLYLPVTDFSELGNYQIRDRAERNPHHAGVSVNPPAAESDFTRLTPADLDRLLGEERYRMAEDVDSLERISNAERLGEEVFPVVIALLLAFFFIECFVANRFYETER